MEDIEIDNPCVYCQHNTANSQLLGFNLCQTCRTTLDQKRPSQINPNQNVYIYLRVSTKEQNNDPNSGLFIQMRQCIEYCFSNNITCIGVYQDIHSAWNMRNGGLRGLREMLGDMGFEIYQPRRCKSKHHLVKQLNQSILLSKELLLLRCEEPEPDNHVDYIIVANTDRFGRDAKNMLAIKHQLAGYNTHVVAVSQMIKTGTDVGNMNFHREVVNAELFSMDKSIRIKSVKSAKRALGNYLGGRAPYGFAINGLNGRRTLIKSIDEQQIIKRIESMHDQGLSNTTIAQRLNQSGKLRRKVQWTDTKVNYILRKHTASTLANTLGNMHL